MREQRETLASTVRRKTFRKKRRYDTGPWHRQYYAERAEKLPSCGTSNHHAGWRLCLRAGPREGMAVLAIDFSPRA